MSSQVLDQRAWSSHLDERQKGLVHQFGVFVGSASLDALAAVSRHPDGLIDDLDMLVRSGLVRRESGDGASRYRLLDTVREFAVEQLASDPLRHEEALDRHATYFAGLATGVGPLIELPQQAEALILLDRDRHDIRAAFDRLNDTGRTVEALRAITATWMYFYIRGYADEGLRHPAGFLDDPARLPDEPRAAGLLAASQLARAVGDLDRAAALAASSVSFYRALSDRRGLAEALFGAGFIARVRPAEGEARELLTAALEAARAVGDHYLIGASLHHLALLERGRGGDGRPPASCCMRAWPATARWDSHA